MLDADEVGVEGADPEGKRDVISAVEALVLEANVEVLEGVEVSVCEAEEAVEVFAARILLTALAGITAWPSTANCPWRSSSQHVKLVSTLVRGQNDPSEQLLSCWDSNPP